MGGGVHLDLFHEIDYCCWFFGLPETNRNILRKVSTLEIEAVDYANINLIYPNFVCNVIMNYYRKTPKRCVEIVFENHSVTLDVFLNTITDDKGKIIFENNNQKVIDTYPLQMKYFLDSLNTHRMPENNFHESF